MPDRCSRVSPGILGPVGNVLALGNGYVGMRGCPEEGGPIAENATLINGFYETHPIAYVEGAYGFARTGQTILSVTDSKIIKLFVDDEPFWPPNADLLRYERPLNMRSARLMPHGPGSAPRDVSGGHLVVRGCRHLGALPRRNPDHCRSGHAEARPMSWHLE